MLTLLEDCRGVFGGRRGGGLGCGLGVFGFWVLGGVGLAAMGSMPAIRQSAVSPWRPYAPNSNTKLPNRPYQTN